MIQGIKSGRKTPIKEVHVQRNNHSCTLQYPYNFERDYLTTEKLLYPITPSDFSYCTYEKNENIVVVQTATYILQGATNADCTNWVTIHTTGTITTEGQKAQACGTDHASYLGKEQFYQFRIVSFDPNRVTRERTYIKFHTYQVHINL